MDGRWNLLLENDYRFSFQDVEEPQLFRDMFEYDYGAQDHVQSPRGTHEHAGEDLDY